MNLLDTPGHRDFSEDTYRVLAAADAAVMVLDAAKGIEPQTLKLFDVCRQRGLPLLSFINKWDRPGLDPVDLLDEIEQQIGLVPTPVTWPVGIAGDFRGVVDRRDGLFTRFTRVARGRHRGPRGGGQPRSGRGRGGRGVGRRRSTRSTCSTAPAPSSTTRPSWPARPRPVFFGSALTNFGVRKLLDAVVELVPSPSPRDRRRRACPDRSTRPSRASCSRWRPTWTRPTATASPSCACARAASSAAWWSRTGPTGQPFATKYAHQVFGQERETIDEAFPGDVVGLVNATDVRVGDSLWIDQPVTFPAIPSFAPEHFSVARVRDTGRFKQFRKGIAQLDEEGVVQVLRDPELGDQAPVLAAVGPMQFEVAVHRLENEFGAPVELLPTSYRLARRTDDAGGRGAQGHARGAGAAPGRRHDPGPVREPVLGRAARTRAARAAARAPGGRGRRRLTDGPATGSALTRARSA